MTGRMSSEGDAGAGIMRIIPDTCHDLDQPHLRPHALSGRCDFTEQTRTRLICPRLSGITAREILGLLTLAVIQQPSTKIRTDCSGLFGDLHQHCCQSISSP